MDYRSLSKSASTRLAILSTNMTPQLEDYDLLRNFRDYKMCMSAGDEPFHLVLNLASVQDEELALTFPEKNVLQVQVVHTRKDMGGVAFARDCVYKFVLPNDLSKAPLTALWTLDDYLVVVESSNIVDIETKDVEQDIKGGRNPDEEAMDVEEDAVERSKLKEEPKSEECTSHEKVLQPRKVSLVFKPNLNSAILRQSMEHAEAGLFYAKRIVQNCSFACPVTKEIVDVKETTADKGTKTKMQKAAKHQLDKLIEDAYYFRKPLPVKKVDLPKATTKGSEASAKPVSVKTSDT